jgi:pyridoxine kinase
LQPIVILKNFPIRYVCDPVLGDAGNLYVPEPLVSIFIEKVIPKAYMVTPNQFEASLLTGRKIESESDAITAMLQLHSLGPKIVALTSAELSDFPRKLSCYIMAEESIGGENKMQVSRAIVDKKDGSFTGTGDATAALLLAWSHKLERESRTKVDSESAISSSVLMNTIATLQAIVNRTYNRQQRSNSAKCAVDIEDIDQSASREKARKAKSSELLLIESRWDIISPPIESSNISFSSWTLL